LCSDAAAREALHAATSKVLSAKLHEALHASLSKLTAPCIAYQISTQSGNAQLELLVIYEIFTERDISTLGAYLSLFIFTIFVLSMRRKCYFSM